MKIRVQNSEVGYAREQPQRLAHDVNADGRVERSKGRIALDLVDQLGSNQLILTHSRSATDGAMPNRHRRREIARVQRIDYQLECDRTARERGRLIQKLSARRVLDP